VERVPPLEAIVSNGKVQSYANHHRYVPLFHFVLSAILLLNLAYALIHAWRHRTPGSYVGLAMAVAFVLIFVYMRRFPLAVQDRLIRLEETLRLERLLPPDLKARIGELSADQLIGLRFAPDAELPALARQVLEEHIASANAIKQKVRSWRADHMRA
jgi:hypothetical protein